MSREEQIKKAADEYMQTFKSGPRGSFINGAEWADQHPHWIPVEERLPEFVYPIGAEVKNTSDYVLVYNGYTMYISRLVGGEIHWWEDNSELAPTHWMDNSQPTNLHTHQLDKLAEKKTHMTSKASTQAGLCSEERSMISPDYARNFICDFILGKPQKFTQLSIFENNEQI